MLQTIRFRSFTLYFLVQSLLISLICIYISPSFPNIDCLNLRPKSYKVDYFLHVRRKNSLHIGVMIYGPNIYIGLHSWLIISRIIPFLGRARVYTDGISCSEHNIILYEFSVLVSLLYRYGYWYLILSTNGHSKFNILKIDIY